VGWVDKWKKQLNEDDFKYFVIKMEDIFEALDEKWLSAFNEILKKYNEHRKTKDKPINKYWLVNRDEPYSDQVKKIIEENEGIKL